MFDGTALDGLAGVRDVRQEGPRDLRVTVDDGASGLPVVVEAITGSGMDVESASEVQISFDEVFALLLERADAEAAADTKEAAA